MVGSPKIQRERARAAWSSLLTLADQQLNLCVLRCNILTESCIFGHQRLYLGGGLLYLGDEAAW